MWLFFAIGSAVFAGITSIFAKIGIKEVDSNLATALRTVVVALSAWSMVFIVGSQSTISQLSSRSLIFLTLSGLATGGSWLCYFRALQLGDVNKVTPIDKSSTVLAMVLAFLFLRERLTVFMVAGMVIIAIGTLLMIDRQATQATENQSRSWVVYATLSAFFAALTAILGKVGIQDIESNLGTAIRTMIVLLVAWGIVLFQGKHRTVGQIDRKSWLFIVLSGLATGFSWLCYYRALQDGKASIVVPIDKLSIVVTIAFSVFYLKEAISKKALGGLVMIVGGTLLLLIK